MNNLVNSMKLIRPVFALSLFFALVAAKAIAAPSHQALYYGLDGKIVFENDRVLVTRAEFNSSGCTGEFPVRYGVVLKDANERTSFDSLFGESIVRGEILPKLRSDCPPATTYFLFVHFEGHYITWKKVSDPSQHVFKRVSDFASPPARPASGAAAISINRSRGVYRVTHHDYSPVLARESIAAAKNRLNFKSEIDVIDKAIDDSQSRIAELTRENYKLGGYPGWGTVKSKVPFAVGHNFEVDGVEFQLQLQCDGQGRRKIHGELTAVSEIHDLAWPTSFDGRAVGVKLTASFDGREETRIGDRKSAGGGKYYSNTFVFTIDEAYGLPINLALKANDVQLAAVLDVNGNPKRIVIRDLGGTSKSGGFKTMADACKLEY